MRKHVIIGCLLATILLCIPVESKDFCKKKGKKYQIGDDVPSKKPCDMCTCVSGDSGKPEVECHTIVCMMMCDGRTVDDGTCCGKCVSDPPPLLFEKLTEGRGRCDPSQCPKLKCSKRFQITSDDTCCPQCKCRHKGEKYVPGRVGDKCSGCTCDGVTGRVKCKAVKCPDSKVQCVDPVMGDDCCYSCPNGITCAPAFSPKTIIKMGEYKNVKNSICACAGEPWYPYAFCASTKINKKSFKGFSEFIAPYMGQ